MLLKFLGLGSAFNVKLGNTASYFENENSIFFIDCGGITFSKILDNNLIDNNKNITIVVTHMHSDHVGSLGDLILYCYYCKEIKPTIVFPNIDNITNYLSMVGVKPEYYNIANLCNTYIIGEASFEWMVQKHVEDIESYGYIIKYNNLKIFYSGDAKEINEDIINRFLKGEIQYIYQDVTFSNKSLPHLNFNKLCNMIPFELRNRVFCMHFDEDFDIKLLTENNFNISHILHFERKF